MEQFRTEHDSMGEIKVPADRYWGAQTQRAIGHFPIGEEQLPREMVHAIGVVKQAAAMANASLGVMAPEKSAWIQQAALSVSAGELDGHFPLHTWISGSGTQFNMNANEVIANRAIELSGGVMGSQSPVHPNDDVNQSQSTNDVFPTAMQIAAAKLIGTRLIPMVEAMQRRLESKAEAWQAIVKIGRTHLQDAVPMRLGQEFSGYAAMLSDNIVRLKHLLDDLYQLPIGGSAVGTGINTPDGFDREAVRCIAELTSLPFVCAANKFARQGSHDAMVMASGAMKVLATSLYKIANDIRLLGSGPRAGLNELLLPANEPGSSIMPGKVNPTQCESMAMAAVQVMGYDASVTFGGAGGHLEMNVYKPLIAHNVIRSAKLLADSCHCFDKYLLEGMEPNPVQIKTHLENSLMLVTALTPLIGYDKASEIAHYAYEKGCSLKEANSHFGYVPEALFEQSIDPESMV